MKDLVTITLPVEDVEALKGILLKVESDAEFNLETYKGYPRYTDEAQADLATVSRIYPVLIAALKCEDSK